ncbi:unnamed protein product [Symbiodinium natans]|uniref:Ubiquitin-like domain-containing protein n=1 Tax=Symbiodinium natans TaxID=878477 RepID=A0A812LLX2_9DINO|nr:unnamed protein product [Symbiodinium natans]
MVGEDPEPSALRVRVVQLSGEELPEIHAQRSWLLEELKDHLHVVTGLPAFEQRLIHGATELADPAQPVGDVAGESGDLELTVVRRGLLAQVRSSPKTIDIVGNGDLQHSRSFAKYILPNHGMALQHLSKELQEDEELALLAVRSNPNAVWWSYCSPGAEIPVRVMFTAALKLQRLGGSGECVHWPTVRPPRFRALLCFWLRHLKPEIYTRVAALSQMHTTTCLRAAAWKIAPQESLWRGSAGANNLKAVAAQIPCRSPREILYAHTRDPAGRRLVAATFDAYLFIAKVKYCGWLLRFCPEFQGDKEVALAVKQNGWAIQHVDRELKEADRSISMAAVRNSYHVMKMIPERWRHDDDVVVAGIKELLALENWRAFVLAPPEMRSRRPILLAAVQRNWRLLSFAPPELREDEDLQAAALRCPGASPGQVKQALSGKPLVRRGRVLRGSGFTLRLKGASSGEGLPGGPRRPPRPCSGGYNDDLPKGGLAT